jgi:thiosulfate reductase cytochrome b subunit
MAESVYVQGLAIPTATFSAAPRHSAVVRVTHWITTLSFIGLLVSGIAILLSHPRLYWGETGAVGAPSLIDLPLPFVLLNQNGWGRHLHFLSAWVVVLNGLLYMLSGFFTQHFRKNLFPAKDSLTWNSFSRVISSHVRLKRPTTEEGLTYNVLQRITYLVVIFFLFPLVIWTGLAMSPAITSIAPVLVTVFGGQQSARTLHFFVSCFLVLFVFVHIGMVCLAGFGNRVRSMITGHAGIGKEQA